MKHRSFLIALFFIASVSACKKKEEPAAAPIPSGNPQNVTTFSGSGGPGFANGEADAVWFNSPRGLYIDVSGNIYIADYGNQAIRRLTPAGLAKTVAGTGSAGFLNETGTAAKFDSPRDLTMDTYGNIFVADAGNNCIRKITSAGVVTTFAGSGTAGADNGKGTAATFNYPSGITIDKTNNLYVSDTYNHLIRKITPEGVVSTFAGSGTAGADNGTGTGASFNNPQELDFNAAGDLIVADRNNHIIRKITLAGVVTKFAGPAISLEGIDGIGTPINLSNPYGITADAYGNCYLTSWGNNLVCRINSEGKITILAGNSTSGSGNGFGTAASFRAPTGIAVDKSGNLYVSDSDNSLIRKVSY